ncbi:hypothetical protein ACFLXC_07075 [Chloroflexota bacterium]
MQIICGWCNKYMVEKDGGEIGDVTHSICEACLSKIEPNIGVDGYSSYKPITKQQPAKNNTN